MDFAEKCDNVLYMLHDEVGEDRTRWITVRSIANQLGYGIGEVMTIAKQLERDGYIQYRPATGGGVIAITSEGIIYAEDKYLDF